MLNRNTRFWKMILENHTNPFSKEEEPICCHIFNHFEEFSSCSRNALSILNRCIILSKDDLKFFEERKKKSYSLYIILICLYGQRLLNRKRWEKLKKFSALPQLASLVLYPLGREEIFPEELFDFLLDLDLNLNQFISKFFLLKRKYGSLSDSELLSYFPKKEKMTEFCNAITILDKNNILDLENLNLLKKHTNCEDLSRALAKFGRLSEGKKESIRDFYNSIVSHKYPCDILSIIIFLDYAKILSEENIRFLEEVENLKNILFIINTLNDKFFVFNQSVFSALFCKKVSWLLTDEARECLWEEAHSIDEKDLTEKCLMEIIKRAVGKDPKLSIVDYMSQIKEQYFYKKISR